MEQRFCRSRASIEHVTRVLEIACDESGYEGEKLIGATTEVFAHASVSLAKQTAADCVQELRDRIRSPATEYKANHLLRDKHREVMRWFLGVQSPVLGHAHVYLIDKPFYILDKVVGLLVEEEPEATRDALYRGGVGVAFLTAANNLLRVKEKPGATPAVEAFYGAIADLRGGPLDRHLIRLEQARPRAVAFRARLLEEPDLISAVDPLIPALIRAVVYWGEGTTPVRIVHDRQTTLSEARTAQLTQLVPEPDRLVGLEHVDSFFDARVQLADIVAGVVRKLASDLLNDRSGVTADMLEPYVDKHSIWGGAPISGWARAADAPSG
jgi:hypothetical protein